MLAGEKPADSAASLMETTLFSQANGSRGGIAFGVLDHSASSGAELISTGPTRATNRPSRLDLQRGIGPFQPMRHLDQECGLNASNSPDHLPTF